MRAEAPRPIGAVRGTVRGGAARAALMALVFGMVATTVVNGNGGPAGAQGGGRQSTTTATRRSTGTTADLLLVADTPSPAKGPVAIVDVGDTSASAIAWMALSPNDPRRLRIAVRNPARLADEGFVVVIRIGVPEGRYSEVTLAVQGGEPKATAQQIEAGVATPLPDPAASSPTTGVIEFAVPAAPAGTAGTATGADAMLWGETRRISNGATAIAATAAFPMRFLRQQGGAGVGVADWALAPGTGEGRLVKTGAPPSLDIGEDDLEVTIPPVGAQTIAGRSVLSVSTVLRIRPTGGLEPGSTTEVTIAGTPLSVTLQVPGSAEPRAVPFTIADGGAGRATKIVIVRRQLDTAIGVALGPSALIGILRRIQVGPELAFEADGVDAPLATEVTTTPGTAASTAGTAPVSTKASEANAQARQIVGLVMAGGGLILAVMFVVWLRTTGTWKRTARSMRRRRVVDGGVRRDTPGIRRDPDDG